MYLLIRFLEKYVNYLCRQYSNYNTIFFHRHLDFEPLITNEEERKAFFINLYNIQMIHGLVAQENLPETPTKVQVR